MCGLYSVCTKFRNVHIRYISNCRTYLPLHRRFVYLALRAQNWQNKHSLPILPKKSTEQNKLAPKINKNTQTFNRYNSAQTYKSKLTLIPRLKLQQTANRGCNNPQLFARCSKTRSQGVKLLQVPLSSSFPLIFRDKMEPTTSPGVG